MSGKLLIPIFILSFLISCVHSNKRTSDISANKNKDTTLTNSDTIFQGIPEKETTNLELYLDSMGLIDIQEAIPSIIIDLRYATENNFTGNILYKELTKAYLHPLAAYKLSNAQNALQKNHPELSLIVFDATRPLSIQQEMYDAVKNTPYRAYVANPERTSLHNYGMAVDISLCNNKGELLDMGTDFDYFGKLAGINEEKLFVRQGLLTQQQVDNRQLLRKTMTDAGFTPIRGEWWHFNAYSLLESRKLARLIK